MKQLGLLLIAVVGLGACGSGEAAKSWRGEWAVDNAYVRSTCPPAMDQAMRKAPDATGTSRWTFAQSQDGDLLVTTKEGRLVRGFVAGSDATLVREDQETSADCSVRTELSIAVQLDGSGASFLGSAKAFVTAQTASGAPCAGFAAAVACTAEFDIRGDRADHAAR